MPVDFQSAIANRQPPIAIPVGNRRSLQNRSVGYNLRKKIPRNFTQTKLRSPLESIKGCEKQAKTKLSEAEKLRIGKECPGRTYHALFQRITPNCGPGFQPDACLCLPSFSRLRPGDRSVDHHRRRSAPPSSGIAYTNGLTLSRKYPKTRKKHPQPKAGISHGINKINQKRGLDPKLKCPLESVKTGLHR